MYYIGIHLDKVKGDGSIDHDSGFGTSLKTKEKSITSDVSIIQYNPDLTSCTCNANSSFC